MTLIIAIASKLSFDVSLNINGKYTGRKMGGAIYLSEVRLISELAGVDLFMIHYAANRAI